MEFTSDKLLGRKKRIWELDFLRGLAICLMCFDHFMYDLAILPSFFTNFDEVMTPGMWEWWNIGYEFNTSLFREICHYIFAGLFLFISGISCTLSKNNFERSLRLFIFAGILTCVTALIDSFASMGALIVFGIIHCLAVSVLIYALIDKFLKNDCWTLIFGAVLIIAGIAIPWYEMEFVPFALGDDFMTFLRAALGFVRIGSDHFPLLPCCGLLLVGSYVGKKFYVGKRSLLARLDGSWNGTFVFIGRRTVWVYMLHQPVIAGIIVFFGLLNGLEVF